MTLLLDTNAFIWSLADTKKLGRSAARDIANPRNNVFVSNLSLLECAIKQRAGKLKPKLDFSTIEQSLVAADMRQLPFDAWAAHHLADLAHFAWADPFDAALIAQAIARHMTLVTADDHILSLAVAGLRTMSAEE
jgi:PIN domain nuclease of toxin-antitoxin system